MTIEWSVVDHREDPRTSLRGMIRGWGGGRLQPTLELTSSLHSVGSTMDCLGTRCERHEFLRYKQEVRSKVDNIPTPIQFAHKAITNVHFQD